MKLIKKILNLIKIKIIKKLYLTKKIDKKKKFTLIYKTNYWSDNDSVSGSGSGKKNTENIIKELSQIIKTYNIKKTMVSSYRNNLSRFCKKTYRF